MIEDNKIYMTFKIVFTGQHSVGKTSLLRRQTDDVFVQQQIATIGVDFKIKRYQFDNIQAKVQMWDSAGQQRFRSIQKPYFRNANAVLLCFDLSNASSFRNVSQQLQQINSMDLVDVPIYLIGCKSDLQPQVFTDQILLFSQAHKSKYYQTSSKENQGVQDCFRSIIQEIVQKQVNKLVKSGLQNKQVNIGSKEQIGIKKRCC